MGDYTKLIVDATVAVPRDELEAEISDLHLNDSAYHSSNYIKQIKEGFKSGELELLLVGQTKWGINQDEFLGWLKPFVIQGSGNGDCYAMQFTEYEREPTCWFMRELGAE